MRLTETGKDLTRTQLHTGSAHGRHTLKAREEGSQAGQLRLEILSESD